MIEFPGLDEAITTGSKDRVYLSWEYLIKDNDLNENDLNDLGQEGWELILICRLDKLYFRRQSIQDKS